MAEAFNVVKKRLCEPAILACTNFNKLFIVETEALYFAVGALLSKKDDQGRMQSNHYASKTVSREELSFSVFEKISLPSLY